MEAVEARERAEQGKTKEQKEQDQAEASAPCLTASSSTFAHLVMPCMLPRPFL